MLTPSVSVQPALVPPVSIRPAPAEADRTRPALTTTAVRSPPAGTGLPQAIGHRGASAAAPENTLPAFDAAWSSGCEWIEADVQPTSDNVPMMLHDADLDRTTDGCGPIRNLSAERVRALDAGSWFTASGTGGTDPDADDDSRGDPGGFVGTVVPSLAEVVARLSPTRALLLEIKGKHTRDQVAAALAVLAASSWNERVLIESFEPDALRHVQLLDPGRPVGLLVQELHADPVAICVELGAVAYNPDHRQLRERPEVVDQLHAAGIAVVAYTVDEPDDWAFLTDLGVDGIITNLPGELLAWQWAGTAAHR